MTVKYYTSFNETASQTPDTNSDHLSFDPGASERSALLDGYNKKRQDDANRDEQIAYTKRTRPRPTLAPRRSIV